MMVAAALAGLGAVMQAAAEGEFGVMYVGRFVAGVGEFFFFFFLFLSFSFSFLLLDGGGREEGRQTVMLTKRKKQESEQQA